MASAYDIWLSAPYCDQKDDRIYAYEQKAKDDIRRELMDDDVFVASAMVATLGSSQALMYIAQAARGEHDAETAKCFLRTAWLSDVPTAEEAYLVGAAEGKHDTLVAAGIKANLVEQVVKAKWYELAETLVNADAQEDGPAELDEVA